MVANLRWPFVLTKKVAALDEWIAKEKSQALIKPKLCVLDLLTVRVVADYQIALESSRCYGR